MFMQSSGIHLTIDLKKQRNIQVIHSISELDYKTP